MILIFIPAGWSGWKYWDFKISISHENQKTDKAQQKKETWILPPTVLYEEIKCFQTYNLGSNALLWKDCDMSHCSLWNPSGEWGQWNFSSSQQPDKCLSFLITLGTKECHKLLGERTSKLKIFPLTLGC